MYNVLMKIKIHLISIFVLVVISTMTYAEIKGTDFSGKSDASICSWFQLVAVPQIQVDEAKKRKLVCGGDHRLIPVNAYVSGDTWKCYSDYKQSGNSCIKKTTSTSNNAYKSCSGVYSSSWTNCYGTYTWSSGSKYIGEWKNGEYDGQGTLLAYGDTYIGYFKNDYKSGKGTTIYSNGIKLADTKNTSDLLTYSLIGEIFR